MTDVNTTLNSRQNEDLVSDALSTSQRESLFMEKQRITNSTASDSYSNGASRPDASYSYSQNNASQQANDEIANILQSAHQNNLIEGSNKSELGMCVVFVVYFASLF